MPLFAQYDPLAGYAGPLRQIGLGQTGCFAQPLHLPAEVADCVEGTERIGCHKPILDGRVPLHKQIVTEPTQCQKVTTPYHSTNFSQGSANDCTIEKRVASEVAETKDTVLRTKHSSAALAYRDHNS